MAVIFGFNASSHHALPKHAMMDSKKLLQKYQALLAENQALKEENLSLKARLGLNHLPEDQFPREGVQPDVSTSAPSYPLKVTASTEKVRLFIPLFKGRDDVYAKRWESKERRAGYAPVCRIQGRQRPFDEGRSAGFSFGPKIQLHAFL
jgi:hypothetical protein